MLIYGHYHRKISKAPVTVQLQNEQGQALPVDIDVFLNIAHVFWIPLFPMGKKVGFKKGDDIFSLKLDALSPKEQDDVQRMRAEAGTPFWSFAGLGLVALFIAWGLWSDGKTNESQKTYSQTPVVGDVWVLAAKDDSTSEDEYALAKVYRVAGDSAHAYISESSYGMKKGSTPTRYDFTKLLRKESIEYSDNTLSFSFTELTDKHEEGMVKFILRANE